MNWGDRLPVICSGTSLPGWAILSSYHSLNLVGKYQIVVKKGKRTKKEKTTRRRQWSREACKKEVQIVHRTQASCGRNCGSQEPDHLAEEEWVKELGTPVKTKDMCRETQGWGSKNGRRSRCWPSPPRSLQPSLFLCPLLWPDSYLLLSQCLFRPERPSSKCPREAALSQWLMEVGG